MIKFKEGVNPEEVFMLQPACLILLGFLNLYAHEHRLPVVITSLYREDSSSHRTHRSVDIRVWGWSKLHQERVCFLMNKKFKNIAAIGAKSGKPVACLAHEVKSQGHHMHLQVKPNALIEDLD